MSQDAFNAYTEHVYPKKFHKDLNMEYHGYRESFTAMPYLHHRNSQKLSLCSTSQLLLHARSTARREIPCHPLQIERILSLCCLA